MHNHLISTPLQRATTPVMDTWPLQEGENNLPVSMLMRVLDESDHGSVVVDCSARVLHANHVARYEMGRRELIAQTDGVLVALEGDATQRLHGVVKTAQRGQRSLISLTRADRSLSLAILPLSHPMESDDPLVLVQLSRLPLSDNLAITLFARNHELSPTEESVMVALCKGLEVPEIARLHRVAGSTIRSQIKSIREKTGLHSIRQLLQSLNALPPVAKNAQTRAGFQAQSSRNDLTVPHANRFSTIHQTHPGTGGAGVVPALPQRHPNHSGR